jgi:hypothetical protein
MVVGAKVEAKCKGSSKYYPGTIAKENSDGTYCITFDDGDKDLEVPQRNIKGAGSFPRDKHERKFEEGENKKAKEAQELEKHVAEQLVSPEVKETRSSGAVGKLLGRLSRNSSSSSSSSSSSGSGSSSEKLPRGTGGIPAQNDESWLSGGAKPKQRKSLDVGLKFGEPEVNKVEQDQSREGKGPSSLPGSGKGGGVVAEEVRIVANELTKTKGGDSEDERWKEEAVRARDEASKRRLSAVSHRKSAAGQFRFPLESASMYLSYSSVLSFLAVYHRCIKVGGRGASGKISGAKRRIDSK